MAAKFHYKVFNPGNLPEIDYREIEPLQGSLKDFTTEGYAKLKASLKKYGIRFPFFLWLDPVKKKHYTVDGHGRLELLFQEQASQKGGSRNVPYVLVEAKDEFEAAELILLASSQYQTVTGFEMFKNEFNIGKDFAEAFTTFDGFFKEKKAKDDGEEKSIKFSNKRNLKLGYTKEEFDKVVEALGKVDEDPARAVWKLLNLGA